MSGIYTGTRSFAIKGMLLDREALEKLAESSSMEEFVNRLKASHYSEYLSQVQGSASARRLELVFRSRLADVHFSLMKASNSKLLEAFYLKRIGWNLKTAIKSKILGKSYDETMEFIDMRAEELVGRRDLIVRVLSAKDVNEALSSLAGTEFYNDLEKAVAMYNTTKEVRVIDTYIDHAILGTISKVYTSGMHDYSSRTSVASIESMIANEVDSYNVLSILRSKTWKIPESEVRSVIIVPAYNVATSTLESMILAESIEEAVKMLPERYIPEQLPRQGEEIIEQIEKKFKQDSVSVSSRAFVWQGLNLAVALAIIKLLENEVSNLSAISVGIEAGMQARQIISSLVFPV